MNNERVDIVDVIEEAIRVNNMALHVAVPAKVLKLGEDNKSVEVEICVSRLFDVGGKELEERKYSPIPDVPVQYPSAGNFSIVYPVKVGDEGMLHFCDANIQQFLDTGNTSAPITLRKHALEDCVFVPVKLSEDKRPEIPAEGVEINAGDNGIVITENGITIIGDVTFKNKVTHEDDIDVPSSDINLTSGDVNVTGGDVTIGVVGMGTHIHTDSTGNPTGPPLPGSP